MSDVESHRPNNIADLVQKVELADIRLNEIVGRRRADGAHVEEQDGTRVKAALTGSVIEIRLQETHVTEEAVLSADVSALFQTAEPLDVPSDLLTEFTERVGVFTVVPYLREAISTTAARLGVAVPLMQLVRQGSIRLTDSQVQGRD